MAHRITAAASSTLWHKLFFQISHHEFCILECACKFISNLTRCNETSPITTSRNYFSKLQIGYKYYSEVVFVQFLVKCVTLITLIVFVIAITDFAMQSKILHGMQYFSDHVIS